MFNLSPWHLLVLAIVGLVLLGPEKLPGLARDAARMIRTLREMATGAREQLRDELGPEFADVDLRNLNPRTVVQRAVFGEEMPNLGKFNPTAMMRDAILGEPETSADTTTGAATTATATEAPVAERVSFAKETTAPAAAPAEQRPRPRPRPGPGAPRRVYDD
ncbi:MAG: Sec-independent protein translocase subunit TatB, partial [Actinobacteria bacterium]|nr:Sec-independent protein translocase subunit TatB [Actinomycetota bacterium]